MAELGASYALLLAKAKIWLVQKELQQVTFDGHCSTIKHWEPADDLEDAGDVI